jgi:hypothetical protein
VTGYTSAVGRRTPATGAVEESDGHRLIAMFTTEVYATTVISRCFDHLGFNKVVKYLS